MEELQTKCLHYEKGLGRMQGVQSDSQDELKIIEDQFNSDKIRREKEFQLEKQRID